MYTRPLKMPAASVAPVLAPTRVAPTAGVGLSGQSLPFSLPASPPQAAAPAGLYASVAQESAAMSASPAQLITMLFDAARSAIVLARHHMARGDVAGKGRAISRAVNIIGNGLKASLDARAGGPEGAQLVDKLEPLYDYICQRLVLGNLRNDPALLNEAERLLDNVAWAWRAVTATGQGAASKGQP